jgi:hypothetical protein
MWTLAVRTSTGRTSAGPVEADPLHAFLSVDLRQGHQLSHWLTFEGAEDRTNLLGSSCFPFDWNAIRHRIAAASPRSVACFRQPVVNVAARSEGAWRVQK